ncbi:hypothetical protein EDD86DRAFT_277891 [Gorgonomyces haynaldii]|nr:hypothetical protein EDD86DRAFT_277891 [Gorgonomyces haynaldii]
MTEKKDIAIIGSGPAGVYCAYILSLCPQFRVHLFEKQQSVGMDGSSFSIVLEDGKMPRLAKGNEESIRIDVPMRSFSEPYYPCLSKLYEHAGIPSKESSHYMSLGQHHQENPQPRPLFSYELFHFRDQIWETPFFFMPLVEQARMMSDYFRFTYACKYYVDTKTIASLGKMTIKEFLDKYKYSKEFADYLLIPLVCNVATCSYESACNYPANVVMDWNRMRGDHRRVSCGINKSIEILTKNVYKIINGAQIQQVYKDFSRTSKPVCVEVNGEKQYFDDVIMAAQANRAVEILEKHPSNNLFCKVLNNFPYEKTNVVTHMDISFLPKNKLAWSPVVISTCLDPKESHASCILNQFTDNIPSECPPIIQTSNSRLQPHPGLVLSRSVFERAVVKTTNAEAIDALNLIQGHNNIYCIGSYAYPGIPLLEGAVVSAMKVSHQLGYTCPWFYADPTNCHDKHPRESLFKMESTISCTISLTR